MAKFTRLEVLNTIIDTGIAHPFAITRIPAHLFVKRMAGTMSAKAARWNWRFRPIARAR